MTRNIKKWITHSGRIEHHQHTEKLGLCEGMNQYTILQLIKRLQSHLGLSDGAILQYELMINYTKDIDWQEGNLCLCYLDVQTTAEILDKSVRQVQYNNDVLVQKGLVSMRLRGDHSRGGVRCPQTGKIVWAYGADLKPVLEQLEYLLEVDEQLTREKKHRFAMRRKVSALMREIRGTVENFCPSLLEPAQKVLACGASFSSFTIERLIDFLSELQAFWNQIEENLSSASKSATSAIDCIRVCNELQTHTHNYNTKDNNLYVEEALGDDAPKPIDEARGNIPHANLNPPNDGVKKKGSGSKSLSLGQALDYIHLNHGVMSSMMSDQSMNASSLVDIGEKTSRLLGISPHAWQSACRTMGREMAAVAIATIEAKGDKILNPGGYLQGMVKKARRGELNLSKTVQHGLRN